MYKIENKKERIKATTLGNYKLKDKKRGTFNFS